MKLHSFISPTSTALSPGPDTGALHQGLSIGLQQPSLHLHLHCTAIGPDVLHESCPTCSVPQTFVATDFEDASASNQREAVASGERYVDKLNEELGKRAPMFVDDANFIRYACHGSGMPACIT